VNILSTLKSKLMGIVGAILLALGLLIGSVQYGRKAQRNEDRVDDMEKYIETKKEIDNVENSPDRDTALDRLRRNGWTG
jgi:hypothetical protein